MSVVLVLVTLTMSFSSQIPSLKMDPAPEKLISSYEGGEHHTAERLAAAFGEQKKAIVVLLEAQQAAGVLTKSSLQYLHTLSRHFQEEPLISDVHSLTLLPLPRISVNDEDDFDDLDEEDEEDQELGDQALGALLDIVDSDPDRFPNGIQDLSTRLSSDLDTSAIFPNADMVPEEIAELKLALSQSSLLDGKLISADRAVALVALELHDDDAAQTHTAVQAIRRYLKDHPAPAHTSVHIGGLPYLRATMSEELRSDQMRLVPFTLLVCMLLLFVSFRWLPGVLLPIGAVGMATVLVLGGMALAGEPINVINNVLPVLLIIIGISDSIHIVGRYREEIAKNPDRQQAGQHTIRTMAVACLLTSVTTAVGLGSLLVSKTVMLRHFGVTAAIGVMVAYGVTITFLPAMLTWTKTSKHDAQSAKEDHLEQVIVWLTRRILRHPWWVLSVTTLVLGLAAWQAFTLEVDHALLDQFDTDSEIYQTTRLLEDKLDGIRPLHILLESDKEGAFHEPALLNALDPIKTWADRPAVSDAILHASGPTEIYRESLAMLTGIDTYRTEPLKNTMQIKAVRTLLSQATNSDSDSDTNTDTDNNPLARWVTEDGRTARYQLSVRDVGAQRTLQLIDELNTLLQSTLNNQDAAVRFAFSGEAYDGSQGQKAVVSDLLNSLLMAIAVIFVLLTLLFRSLRLGLLSIPPNLLPLVGTMAYMSVRGIPLNTATVIIFSVSLGLAVDGTIHVLARYREETHQGKTRDEALLAAARGTGKAIVVSCVTLMVGFSVLLMSSFVPVQHFGELIAVTVGATLLATLLVQPALLKVAGFPDK